MVLGRNDPCRCGSGRKYKKCHGPLDSAAPEDRVQVSQSIYKDQWQKNAAHLESQGCYEWMSSQLKPYAPKRILDIGCGEGNGLVALLTTFGPSELSIFSLDENSQCLHSALKKLRSKGFEAKMIDRLVTEPTDEYAHILGYREGMLRAPSPVMLIGADLLSLDPETEDFLSSLPAFDAVTAWLIGTHDARYECVNIANLNITSPLLYRLRVENKAYVLADQVLKSGGVLQVVTRGEFPATELLKQSIMNSHREQASVTNLELLSFECMEYTEIEANTGRMMGISLGTSGRVPDTSRLAIVSVISLKP